MRAKSLLIALLLVTSGCGQLGGPDSCDEYAAELRDLIESGPTVDEVEAFLMDSEETVARLIADDPDGAEPCVEAVFELTFTGVAAELEESFEDE